MKIVVTGGAGFIGSHVVDAYVKAGHAVAVIDNLVNGSRANVNPRAKFYKADIRDRAAMDRIFKKERPETVNHHAALIDVVASVRDPIPTLQTNVLGLVNVLLAFGKYGRGKNRRFIFSSSGGAIYGAPKHLPADEHERTITLSPYGLAKHLGEEAIAFYARHYGFDRVIFRYANIYGPRQKGGVVAIFGKLMKADRCPVIFGDGTKARDYVYVGDAARANLIALRRGKGETVNLGNGTLVTDRKIFDAIARELKFEKKPVYAPYRKGEVYLSSLSARKAKKILGWQPRVSLRDGIRATLRAL